jgi:hypothetical protein
MNVLVTGGTGVCRSRMENAGIKPPGGCMVRVFEPASWDLIDTRPHNRPKGTRVVKMHPGGTPRTGPWGTASSSMPRPASSMG